MSILEFISASNSKKQNVAQARRHEPSMRGCRFQFFRLKLVVTLNIPTEFEFDEKIDQRSLKKNQKNLETFIIPESTFKFYR